MPDDLISETITFSVHSPAVTLDEIDALYDVLFPSFHVSRAIPMKTRMKRARSVIEGIVNLSRDEVQLDRPDLRERTHSDWFCILSALEANSYCGRRNHSTLLHCGFPQQLPGSMQDLTDSSTHTDCIESQSVAAGSDACEPKSVATYTGIYCSVKSEDDALHSSPDEVNNDKFDPNIVYGKTEANMQCNDLKLVSVVVVVHEIVTDSSCDKSKSHIHSKLPSTRLDSGELCKVGHSGLCNWCHKRRHTLENCWRRLQLCLICGGKHSMTLCPRYAAPSGRQFVPTCSICNGKHLGTYCRKSRVHLQFCHWCGKHGHEENNCWAKNRCCLICEGQFSSVN